MGSTRLPGKSMMDMAGAPLVGRILERVKDCSKLDDIVLAIPDTKKDLVLKEVGECYGIKVFSGSENDLVERYYQAAIWSKADFIVRLPADNATPEPSEIDRIVDHHLTLGRPGFSSNLSEFWGSGYPDGIGAEIFDFSLLKEAHIKHDNPLQREHVHLNFFDYSTGRPVDEQWCPVSTVKCPKAFRRPDIVLDINTYEEYEYMLAMYRYLYVKNQKFSIYDIIRWHDTVYCVQDSSK